MLRLLFLLCLLLLISQPVSAQDFLHGKVVGVTDGDTFTLLTTDTVQVKVRVANIDCPERKQPFYQKAKQFVSEAIFNKAVKVTVIGTDRYRRIIGDVTYGENLNLSRELVKHGYAWHFVRYSDDAILQALEDKARRKKVGLWVDPRAIAPWEWRKGKRVSGER